MLRVSAWAAIAFGLLLAVLEAVRNWGDWQWWPFWVVDYVAAALLVVGGVAVVRGRSVILLAAGWGFTCAMFWMSYFSHLDGLKAAVAVDAKELQLTRIIGVMFVITIAGLVSVLAPKRETP